MKLWLQKIIKYYNIGVTTSGVPTLYTTSESVELMSNRYTYYEQISVPIYSSPIGGGGVSEDLSSFTVNNVNN